MSPTLRSARLGILVLSASCAQTPDRGKPLERTLPLRSESSGSSELYGWQGRDILEPEEVLPKTREHPGGVASPSEGAPGTGTRVAGPEPRPRPQIGDDQLRQLDLRDAPLAEALHLIGSMAGVNLYLDAGLGGRVDASFPAVRLDDALEVLLARSGLVLTEDPPGIFWVTRGDGSQVETARFQLRSVHAADIVANLEALVGSETTLVADQNQNFVVVRGPRSDIDAVDEYLLAADRLKSQVLIEVEILEVILQDRFELGIQHLLSDPNFLGELGLSLDQDFSTSADAFRGTLSLNDFSLSSTINALSEFGAVNVLSSPRVMAVTNTQAAIDVVREIPYIETTTEISGDAGTVGTSSQQTVNFKEAGIKLLVTPIVQEGGIVQLAVDQEFSEVLDFFMGIPVLDSRRVTTQFLVGGEQAVVLGGLLQTRKTETDRGVPVLMHVPLLGRLFRSDADDLERRELLILIRPRILDPAEAADLARRYRDRFEERLKVGGITKPEKL